MRISGGVARGVTLAVPKGDFVRPATDGMRQAVFSSLAARMPGAWVWDLFAGTGAYGLEAVSRGAVGGVFIEKNPKAVGCIRQNISSVCKSMGRGEEDLTVLALDVLAGLSTAGGRRPELVFIDPPYDLIEDLAPKLFARLGDALSGQRDPVVVFEMPGECRLEPRGWTCVHRLGKGARQPTVAFFRRSEAIAAGAVTSAESAP